MLEMSQVTQDVVSATGRLFELWVLVFGGDNDPARRVANNFELRSTPALRCRLLPLTTETIITQPYARLAHITVTCACNRRLLARAS
jgi:hypothetical protein